LEGMARELDSPNQIWTQNATRRRGSRRTRSESLLAIYW
jgi:hypothetical protein